MTKDTWIYLIHDIQTNFVKIGESIKPADRLRDLRRQPTLLPLEHQFILIDAWQGTRTDEQDLHRRYAEYRIRGEWFALPPSAFNEIRKYFYDRPSWRMESTPRDEDNAEARELGVLGPHFYLFDPCSGDYVDFLQEVGETIG